MFSKEEKEYITEFIKDNDGSIYLGCDSQKYNKHSARYTVVLIVHIEDSKGCKIFGYTETETDYDKNISKPRMRLMTEVEKVVSVYTEFEDVLIEKNVEIHLDINPNPVHNSNIIFKQACGYVMGMTGIEPTTKPDAFASSHCGDHYVRGKNNLNNLNK